MSYATTKSTHYQRPCKDSDQPGNAPVGTECSLIRLSTDTSLRLVHLSLCLFCRAPPQFFLCYAQIIQTNRRPIGPIFVNHFPRWVLLLESGLIQIGLLSVSCPIVGLHYYHLRTMLRKPAIIVHEHAL